MDLVDKIPGEVRSNLKRTYAVDPQHNLAGADLTVLFHLACRDDTVMRRRQRAIRHFAFGQCQGRARVAEFSLARGHFEFSGAHDGAIERVALKTVRLDAADKDDSIQRFRLEILHSRKVSHPNVSRIFESGRHRLEPAIPGGPSSEILFFTMELLDGVAPLGALTERLVADALAALEAVCPAPSASASTLTQQHALIRSADEYGDLFTHAATATQSCESTQP